MIWLGSGINFFDRFSHILELDWSIPLCLLRTEYLRCCPSMVEVVTVFSFLFMLLTNKILNIHPVLPGRNILRNCINCYFIGIALLKSIAAHFYRKLSRTQNCITLCFQMHWISPSTSIISASLHWRCTRQVSRFCISICCDSAANSLQRKVNKQEIPGCL